MQLLYQAIAVLARELISRVSYTRVLILHGTSKFACFIKLKNGSKVLIYLTLLNVLLHYLQVKYKIQQSQINQNCGTVSYRGLPFEVSSQTLFQKYLIKIQLQTSNSTTSKGPTENFKKMSWDNPVSSHRC